MGQECMAALMACGLPVGIVPMGRQATECIGCGQGLEFLLGETRTIGQGLNALKAIIFFACMNQSKRGGLWQASHHVKTKPNGPE